MQSSSEEVSVMGDLYAVNVEERVMEHILSRYLHVCVCKLLLCDEKGSLN